jgi:hypothetical protein
MLLEALDDLSKGKYKESLGEQSYRLDDLANDNTKKTFYISAADFSKKQEITQTAEGRMIQVYSNMMNTKRRCYRKWLSIRFSPKENQ